MGMSWSIGGPAFAAAFAASTVEFVEAFTIVLAVATLRGWRPALTGAVAGFALLALMVLVLGPLLGLVPVHGLQLAIGVLLLLFGMGWLRKAVLRAAGIIALHNEDAIFAEEKEGIAEAAAKQAASQDWIAGIAAFKAVLLEGLEVVFIVIAVGAGRGLIGLAALGAFGAFILVLIAGMVIHKPLARVPENTLKFGVGVMLSSFGVFWTGEGLGVAWPGQDFSLLGIVIVFLATGLITASLLRAPRLEAAE
jgi:uncharacterized membrane protein